LRRDLWRVIERLNAAGTTILLTTHYIEEAERLCDRVAILDEGEVIEVSTPNELMERGLDEVRVTVAGGLASPPAFSNGSLDAEVQKNDLVIRTKNAGKTLAGVLRDLEDGGHEVVDVGISRVSLEQVFVEMTHDHGDVTRTPPEETEGVDG